MIAKAEGEAHPKGLLYNLVWLGLLLILLGSLQGVYSRLAANALLIQLAVFLTALPWAAGLWTGKASSLGRGLGAVKLPLIVFMALSFVTSIVSSNPGASFAAFGLNAAYALLLVMALRLRGGDLDKIIKVILLLGLAMGLLGLFFFWGQLGQGANPVMNALFGNKNHFAGYLLLIWPLALSLYLASHRPRELLAYGATSLFLGVCLLLTYSRAGWLSLVAALVVGFMAARGLWWRQSLARLVLLALLVGLTAFLMSRGSLPRSLQAASQGAASLLAEEKAAQGTLAPRLDYWQGAMAAIKDRPLSGSGLGTFGDVFPRYQADPRYFSKYAHNYFLQMGVEMGLPGLLAALWLYGAIASVCIRLMAKARYSLVQEPPTSHILMGWGLGMGILGSTLHNLLDFDWFLPSIGLLFWVEVGLALKLASSEDSQEGLAATRFRLPFIVFSAAMALWAALQLASLHYTTEGAALLPDGISGPARSSLELASHLNPLQAEPHRLLAQAYLESGELDRALSEGRSAASVAPGDPLNHALLGRIYLAAGRGEDNLGSAIAEFEQVTLWRPPWQAAPIYLELARLYLGQEREPEARALLERLASNYQEAEAFLDPATQRAIFAEAYILLGNLDARAGELPRAMEYYRASLDLNTRSVAYFNLGLLLFESGEMLEALPYLQTSVIVDPNHAPGYYYLGLTYRRLGQEAEAEQALKRALSLDPNLEAASRANTP